MLQIHIAPLCGGDTMFSDMYAAYDALSDPIKKLINGLSAAIRAVQCTIEAHADRNVDLWRVGQQR